MAGKYNKFFVALIGAFVSIALKVLSTKYGIDLTIYETDIVQGVSSIAPLITAYFVWLVPNAQPEGAKCPQCSAS